MRVYVSIIFSMMLALCGYAMPDDDREVTLVGDQNYRNSATLVYDGIDVSNYQKDIDWSATAKDPNIKYVYIKATEGVTHKQHRYRRNLENARRHGIKVGSYHFMRTGTSIKKQFENFISVVHRDEQDLVPLLDVETREGWTIKQLQDSVLYFAQLLEEHFGCKPMIYTSSSYFNNYLGATFASYPLFIARYAKSEPQLKYGAKWILWQFSDRGQIDGIDALVDLSRFNKGCSVKDIAYTRAKKPSRARDNGYVPRPKPKVKEEKPAVPPRPVQNTDVPRGNKTEAQKRGEEAQRKREKMEEEKRREEAKKEEKRRKEEEKKRKEMEKRQKELEKKRLEQERKQQQEEAKKKSREQAQERMKKDKERADELERARKQQQEEKRKQELEKNKQERLEQQRKSTSTTGAQSVKTAAPAKAGATNNSSADNDEVKYNTTKKPRWQDNVKKKNN